MTQMNVTCQRNIVQMSGNYTITVARCIAIVLHVDPSSSDGRVWSIPLHVWGSAASVVVVVVVKEQLSAWEL